MKQIPIHKGGRPTISEGRRKKYLLSLRLDAEHYFKLKALVRIFGMDSRSPRQFDLPTVMYAKRLCREHLDFHDPAQRRSPQPEPLTALPMRKD